MSELRKISEQELKDILDNHGKWLRDEEDGVCADLSSADLRYADLRSADLRSADLRSADLSYANLSHANLSYANLSYADLRYADLRSADLSSADLRYADLSYANLSHANLAIFQFQRHQAFYTLDGTLRIGCFVMPVTEWLLGFEEIGKKNGYDEEQIKAYGNFIKSCAELLNEQT